MIEEASKGRLITTTKVKMSYYNNKARLSNALREG
jgi:hypothetical protein